MNVIFEPPNAEKEYFRIQLEFDEPLPPGDYTVKVIDKEVKYQKDMIRVLARFKVYSPTKEIVVTKAEVVRPYPTIFSEEWKAEVVVDGENFHQAKEISFWVPGREENEDEVIEEVEREVGQMDFQSRRLFSEILKWDIKMAYYYHNGKRKKILVTNLVKMMKEVTEDKYLILVPNVSRRRDVVRYVFEQSLMPPEELRRKLMVVPELTEDCCGNGRNYVSNVLETQSLGYVAMIGRSDERDHVIFVRLIPSRSKISKRSPIKEVKLKKPTKLLLTQGDLIIKLLDRGVDFNVLKRNALKCLLLTAQVYPDAYPFLSSKKVMEMMKEELKDSDDLITVINALNGVERVDFLDTHSHTLYLHDGIIYMAPKYGEVDGIFVENENRIRQEHVIGIIYLKKGGKVEIEHHGEYAHKPITITAEEEVYQPFEARLESQFVLRGV